MSQDENENPKKPSELELGESELFQSGSESSGAEEISSLNPLDEGPHEIESEEPPLF